MATLSDLITTLSWTTSIPEATVFAYGRFAREAGLISQGGRGKGAATMTVRDAANLLIAVGGTAVTRDAGTAIKRFRPMRGTIYAFRLGQKAVDWLAPLGIRRSEPDKTLRAGLGKTLEFLIEQTQSGGLQRFLSSIPSVTLIDTDVPSMPEILLTARVEEILRKAKSGTVEKRPAVLQIEFDRSTPMARVRIARWWGVPEIVAEINFYPSDVARARTRFSRPLDLNVIARVSAATLAALGLSLRDIALPADLGFPLDLESLTAGAPDQKTELARS
jgi:hypothetical protein